MANTATAPSLAAGAPQEVGVGAPALRGLVAPVAQPTCFGLLTRRRGSDGDRRAHGLREVEEVDEPLLYVGAEKATVVL